MEDKIFLNVGNAVQHTEQKYIGRISQIIDDEYCLVKLDNEKLNELYPFGCKAKFSKLKLIKEDKIIIPDVPIEDRAIFDPC
jgi:hypothetical protein